MIVGKFNHKYVPLRDGVQACIICGRFFINRAERVCSVVCREKAEQDEQLEFDRRCAEQTIKT